MNDSQILYFSVGLLSEFQFPISVAVSLPGFPFVTSNSAGSQLPFHIFLFLSMTPSFFQSPRSEILARLPSSSFPIQWVANFCDLFLKLSSQFLTFKFHFVPSSGSHNQVVITSTTCKPASFLTSATTVNHCKQPLTTK